MTTETTPKRRGRPPGSTTERTARLPDVRCTPQQRQTFDRLGGADWLRQQIDRAARRMRRA